MSQHLRMGALNKDTGNYEKPSTADKKNKYICPDCKRDVIVKKGNIKVHHFAHKSQENPCVYYKHPNEDQIHKDAKMLMKNMLDSKRVLCFNRYCIDCKKVKKMVVDGYTETTKIIVEYRFHYNDSVQTADVAYLDNDEIKYIFEICNTHSTNPERRPEPWFEVEASSFINSMNEEADEVTCIREQICEDCVIRKKLHKQWLEEKRILEEEKRILEEKIKKEREEEQRNLKLKSEEEQRNLKLKREVERLKFQYEEEKRLRNIKENRDKPFRDKWAIASSSIPRCNRCKLEKRCKECDKKILKLYNDSVRSK